jgi:flagellar hook-basal body complex protein FliE
MIGPMTGIGDVAGQASGVGRAPAASAGGSAQSIGGASFAAVLGEAMAGVADGVRAAETSALGALNGTGTMQDTVSHMMMAERQLQQAIAVRDKLVSAYMDLTRMQI